MKLLKCQLGKRKENMKRGHEVNQRIIKLLNPEKLKKKILKNFEVLN